VEIYVSSPFGTSWPALGWNILAFFLDKWENSWDISVWFPAGEDFFLNFSKASRPVPESTQPPFQVNTSSGGKIRENLFAVNRTVGPRGRTLWLFVVLARSRKYARVVRPSRFEHGGPSCGGSNSYYRRKKKNIYLRPNSWCCGCGCGCLFKFKSCSNCLVWQVAFGQVFAHHVTFSVRSRCTLMVGLLVYMCVVKTARGCYLHLEPPSPPSN